MIFQSYPPEVEAVQTVPEGWPPESREECPLGCNSNLQGFLSLQQDANCLGLAGVVSERLPPEAQEGFHADCVEDTLPLFLTVRWTGRFHSVAVRESDCSPMDKLAMAVLGALYPSEDIERNCQVGPRLDVFGCTVDTGQTASRLQKLRRCEEPKTWSELRLFCGRAGYVVLDFPLDGGADQGSLVQMRQSSQTVSTAQMPAAGDIQAWTDLDVAFSQLQQGISPVIVLRGPQRRLATVPQECLNILGAQGLQRVVDSYAASAI